MKKILLVDDEKEVSRLIAEKLSQSNFQVMTASNGREALEISHTWHPDLILLDIAMPQMDGYATCEKLKEDPESKDIPVLFLTGKDLDEEGIVEHCDSLGARGHISKLSSLGEILEKVKEVLFRETAE